MTHRTKIFYASFFFAYILLLAELCSCQKEESQLPSYKQEILNAYFDKEGILTKIQPDAGIALTVSNHYASSKYENRILRAYALYIQKGKNKAEVKSIIPIFIAPMTTKEWDKKSDSLHIVSAWSGGGYLNCHLRILTSNSHIPHQIAFYKSKHKTLTSRHQLWEVYLYHDQGKDPMYFWKDVYVATPFNKLSSSIAKGDTVKLIFSTPAKTETILSAF